MKANIYKSKVFTTVSVVIVTLIIAILANWFQIAAERAVVDTTIREMSENGQQQKFTLEQVLKDTKKDLTTLANYIAQQNVKSENVVEFLQTQSQVNSFNNFYYIDIDGNGISPNDEKRDFSKNQSFLIALEDEYYISYPKILIENREAMLDIFVPVILDGAIAGVLYTELCISEFFQLSQSSISGQGDLFILDHELNFIFSTSDSHVGLQTIPTYDLEEMGFDNVAQAQADILAGNSGSFDYDYGGNSKVITYFPIEMTEWVVALNVETNVINSDLATAVDQLKLICQMIYWFLILLIIYIWFSQTRSMKMLEKTAYYDSLTGLPNMEKFKKDMKDILEKNKNKSFSVLIFDIENFKVINELYGFEMGDRVLKNMKNFSNSLNEPTLIFARIGADKFAMFASKNYLEDVYSIVVNGKSFYDETIPELVNHDTGFKAGRYNIEKGETDVDDIINKVNLAHKTSKDIEGQMFCDYDDAFKTKILKEANITNRMRNALTGKEFKVYMQPKYSVVGDKLIGAEALVRWITADGKMVYPDEFIPLFERNGFIVELDEYVLENTCIALRDWNDKGFGYLPVSVNCSRLNINKPNFVDNIINIVDKYNIPHKYIEIEITESTTTENEEVLKDLFTNLREQGFKISIDDFGSGYSSLSMLKNLRVDILKMDRSFFIDGNEEGRSDLLIDGVVKLAHNLSMFVVAEGIETEKQIEMLKNMKCDAVQGYFYAKPMSISEFEEKYANCMPNKV